MIKKKYLSEDIYKGKYFIDYLPDEVFNQMSEEDRVNYREYRRYSTFIKKSELLIEDYEKQILKLKDKISKERLKIGGVDSTNNWLMKMKDRFDSLSHLNENFVFSCSVTKRIRKSKTLKFKDGKKSVKDNEMGVLKETYKGEELKPVVLWYSQIVNSSKSVFKTIYLGKEENIRKFLNEIYPDENWSEDDMEDVRSEMKTVISQYVRYTVFHNTWKPFEKGQSTHNLETILKWCKEVGDERYDWGGKI